MDSTILRFCPFTSCRKMPSVDVEDMQKKLSDYGQEHLLKFWPRLSPEQRSHLVNDIQSIDFPDVLRAFSETISNQENNNQKLDSVLQPIPEELHEGVSRCSPTQLQSYRDEGLSQIASGRVAALLLAGGQGTRLGVGYPKGMFEVGLPSRKTLYQLQGERLLRLQELAHHLTGKRGSIPWYIMTSEHTMEPTLEFFDSHDYFGLKKENLTVFEQYMLPCLTFDGKIILETPWKIAKAPDGNGGLFRALQRRGILEDMNKRGIRYIHVYCVDNILVKMADPVFIGYCISKDANCAAKVVEKNAPTESVGVVCRVDGKFQVVEYSEVSTETAQRRNTDGRLTFNAGNICNHFFTIDFLNQIGNGSKQLKHHIAQKKITCVGEDGSIIKPLKPNGIKLEKFVFDVFVFSDKFAAWEVLREEEFSPMKNADGCAKDTPTTARHALYSLHRSYIENAGGKFIEQENHHSRFVNVDLNGSLNGHHNDSNTKMDRSVQVCEISPLVSYDGEGLEEFVSGKILSGPVVISSADEQTLFCSDTNGNRED